MLNLDSCNGRFTVVNTFKIPELECPKCKRVIKLDLTQETIRVSLPGRECHHCIFCYADWLKSNIPVLVPVERPNPSGHPAGEARSDAPRC